MADDTFAQIKVECPRHICVPIALPGGDKGTRSLTGLSNSVLPMLVLIRFWSKSVKGQGHSEVKHSIFDGLVQITRERKKLPMSNYTT